MLVSAACLLIQLAPAFVAPSPEVGATDETTDVAVLDEAVRETSAADESTGADPAPAAEHSPASLETVTASASVDAPGAPPRGTPPLRARPRVGLGPIVWERGDGSIAGRSSAGLAGQALSSVGVSHATVLHPADADVFVTGTMSYEAAQHNPRSTGRGAIRAGIGILVGGTLAGLAAGLTLRYVVEGSEHSRSNMVIGLSLAPSVVLGSGLIIGGNTRRREARRERAIHWELSADLRVRVGVGKARRMRITKRGSQGCGADLGCEEGIETARRSAVHGFGSAFASGIDVAANGGGR